MENNTMQSTQASASDSQKIMPNPPPSLLRLRTLAECRASEKTSKLSQANHFASPSSNPYIVQVYVTEVPSKYTKTAIE
jgi:hypothetical protein